MAKTEIIPQFEYGSIDDADDRGKLQYITGEVSKLKKRHAENQAALAKLVFDAHAILANHKNGSFIAYVQDELRISAAWADELRCIGQAAEGNEKNITYLVGNTDTVRTAAKLGKKSTPEKAREACMKAVKSGGVSQLTSEFVDAQIKKYKEPPTPRKTAEKEFDEIPEADKLFNTDFEPVEVPKGRKRCQSCGGVGHTAENKADFGELLAFWQGKYPHARGDETARQKFRDRIKDGYTVRELKMAVVGMHSSEFHVNGNHLTLFVCLKNADNVNKFIELYRQEKGLVAK